MLPKATFDKVRGCLMEAEVARRVSGPSILAQVVDGHGLGYARRPKMVDVSVRI